MVKWVWPVGEDRNGLNLARRRSAFPRFGLLLLLDRLVPTGLLFFRFTLAANLRSIDSIHADIYFLPNYWV